MTDLADGPALEVVRWRRYGQDRIYVNTHDGTRVGWLDRKTGETTLEIEELRTQFERALAGELPLPKVPSTSAGTDASTPDPATYRSTGEIVASPAHPPVPAATAIEQPWSDLAANRPGEGVAGEAKRAFSEAPIHSIAARIFKVHTEERAWRLGAKGEALVGKQLAKLPPTWRALHSVPVGSKGSDIDHLVIGPGGVYTINAKHHPEKEVWVHRNTFIVDGFRQPYIRNARYEADRAQRLLSDAVGHTVPVIGLIAVIGAHKGFTVKAQPVDGRVIVLTRRGLADWLGRLGPVLTSEQVERIYDVGRRSTTWV